MARGNARFTWSAPRPRTATGRGSGGDLQWVVGPAALRFEYLEVENQRRRMGPGGRSLDDRGCGGLVRLGRLGGDRGEQSLKRTGGAAHPFWPFAERRAWVRGKSRSGTPELTSTRRTLNFLGGTGSTRSARPRPTGPRLYRGVNWYLTAGSGTWSTGITTGTTTVRDPLSCRRLTPCTTTSPTVSQLHKRQDPTSGSC